ncbi:SusC/RagA family TonB-linked outer membrane protein [Sphingobacterium bambusae]|uniref:TonB-dependent receptor n=1 Tax=Sphingobacterium bambusae TaxID=662858 RepID=A0ABW6BEV0_9SPHI|nr:TonB-dependent receptor [Sphingobacterium bambusae]WPL47151.1 TonB-dependent receptor [Sphingobacterium bambusae]
MKEKLLSMLVVLICLIGGVFAQNRQVSGRVTSAQDGTPISGVSVTLVGSTTATQTDAAGNYSISVTGNVSLVYSYVGYITQRIAVANRSVVNVELLGDRAALDEVVVVGYGTIRATDLTGSVSKVNGEKFQDVAIPSLDKFLQGQAAGVQASTPSGMLGQAARIRIRGTNSISNSSDPLYVVDGVPYITGNMGVNTTTNPLSDINPNDIASVEILKDGASTAIYGSRAANGVVLITTKRGLQGTPKLTYDNWFASASPSKRFDLLNAQEFIEVTNEKLRNANLPEAAFPTPIPGSEGQFYDTDWQSEILRSAFQHNHALSLSGGSERTNYFVSLGYAEMDGIINPNSLRRYTLRTRLEQKAFEDRLTIGVNTAVAHTTNRSLNVSGNALSGNIEGAIYAFPNVPAIWPDGTYNLSGDLASLGQGANLRPIRGNYTNQAYVRDNNIYKNSQLNLTGNAFADVLITDGLNFRSQIGINYLLGEDYLFWHPGHGDGRGVGGRVMQYSVPVFRYNWHNLLTYVKKIGDHSINVVAGQELQMTSMRNFLAHGTGISSTYFGENENIISGSLNNQFIGGGATENAIESYFVRANYSYKDRYLLSGTLRHDKLSALPWGNQSATLPGVSFGWRISEEDFFNKSFVNNLKIRSSWATVGNTEIGNYPFAGIFSATQYGTVNAIRYSQIANPDLRFETSRKFDAGIDVGILADRITFTADYFRNDINNLILAVPLPPSLGVPQNQINRNVGEMYNRGFEFTLNSKNIENDNFSWNSSFNISFVKNRVQRLVDGQPINFVYHTVQEGESIGSFFGFVNHGVNSANGNPIFEKADGTLIQQQVGTQTWALYNPSNPEDVTQTTAGLVLADKRILGESNPTWYGGFDNTFTYKSFDLNVFLTFSGGNMVYNRTRQESLNHQQFAGAGRELLDRWTTPGQQTDVPRLYWNSDPLVLQTGNLNSRFLERGDFLRLQNFAIGYSFPPNVLRAISANKIRVYAQVQNAFVFTSYSGLDPELSNSNTTNSQASLDFSVNPIPRTYTIGLNVGF